MGAIVMLLLSIWTIHANNERTMSNHASDYDCAREVKLAEKNELELVMLASFPGSGNTWVRLLLEDASGFYTGSVYTDKSLGRSGFIGEYEDKRAKNTIAVKCHGFNGLVSKGEAQGVILLIRNPYDAILAEWNRRRSPKPTENGEDTHTGMAPPALFNSTLWTKQCAGYTHRWTELHEKYAKWTPKKD